MAQRKKNNNAETLNAFGNLLGKAAEFVNALNKQSASQPQDGVRQRISSPEPTSVGIDPYQLLGLASTATKEEIAARFRALMKIYHPDAGAGDDTMAKLINNAAVEIKRKRGW